MSVLTSLGPECGKGAACLSLGQRVIHIHIVVAVEMCAALFTDAVSFGEGVFVLIPMLVSLLGSLFVHHAAVGSQRPRSS